MVEVVGRFEYIGQVCNMDLDNRAQFVQQRTEPIIGAMLIYHLARFEGCCSAVDGTLNGSAEF